MRIWRCEMYADVLLQYPCVTLHIRAVDIERATALMHAELANIQVLLRSGPVEDSYSNIKFEQNEEVRVTRYVPGLPSVD